MFSTIQIVKGVTTQEANHDIQTIADAPINDTIPHFGNGNLQEIIDHASAGATLELPGGIFHEILHIDKPLRLIGRGAGETIIAPVSSPNGYAISITAPNVTLSGLEITNQGLGLYTTGVKISAPNFSLDNCTIHDCPVGIAIWSPKNTITNCDFYYCNDEAIVLLGTPTDPCYGNRIRYCTFTGNCDGIELQYSAHNTVERCQFTNNTHAGIDAITQSNQANDITRCSFSGNKGFGLYLAGASETLISDCSFTDDAMTFVQSPQNIIRRSHFSHIRLLNDSSLLIQDCGSVGSSAITSVQSQFNIQNDRITFSEKTMHHPLLLFIQTRLLILKTLLRSTSQSRL
jgi:parallel beta-helix repeat protein